jgi:hypothetical protein
MSSSNSVPVFLDVNLVDFRGLTPDDSLLRVVKDRNDDLTRSNVIQVELALVAYFLHGNIKLID